MKKTIILAAIGLLFGSQSAVAGFLFESGPIVQSTVPKANERQPADAATTAGRNVDQSAPLARVAKFNRQRVDLESKLTSRITQEGEQPAELPIVRGMGRDVTLEDALRQVLPVGWSVFSDQDMPLAATVSWSGSKTWPMVLHGILADKDMRANIDWKNREIMFFVPLPKPEVTMPLVAKAPGVEVRTVPNTDATKAPAQPQAPNSGAVAAPSVAALVPPSSSTAVTPAKAEEKVAVWSLEPDVMLRENLRRWTTASGWTLIWNAVSGGRVIDYTVDAKVDFTGDLIGANGAIARVISAYYDAEVPLEVMFYRGNKVVEVRLHQVPDTKPILGASVNDPSIKPQGGTDLSVSR